MNIISIIIGVIALILEILIIIPFVGHIISWIVIPIGIVGLLFGLLSRKNSGRNLNIVVLIIALLRITIL